MHINALEVTMTWTRSCFRTLLAGVLILASSTTWAQLNRGVVEGIVTDPQGGIIPGTAVTITSVDTNVSVATKTNGAGLYQAVNLVPGKYHAHFEVSGFSPLEVSDIQVQAGAVTRLDAHLHIGATLESVQVRAEAALVDREATNASTTLDPQEIENVPLQGRDLQQLVFMVPGVNNAGGPPGSNFGFNSQYGTFPDPTHVMGSDLSVNGGQAGANSWYLDGNLNLSSESENIVVNPSPDAVQEFQAITSAFSAEYSRTGGAVFNVVLKSGTNTLHGDVYEYVRNDATNARNPFTSIDALGNLIKDRQLRFNNFGGTLGGPVILPHLYDGKNRSFFFLSWDASTLHLLGNRVFTVPTPLMREGNFSEDANTATYGIWDPNSTVGPDAQGLFERTAFGTPVAGNPYGASGCLNSSVEGGAAQGISTCNFATQIPTNRLDPVAMFFMKSFPLPNYNDPLSNCPMASGGASQICNNFLGPDGASQTTQNVSLKIDHTWSDKSSYFAEWLYNPTHYTNYRVPWTGPTFPQPEIGWNSSYPFDIHNQIFAIGNTYLFNPTLINQFRASFSRQLNTTHPSSPFPNSISDQSAVQQELAPLGFPTSGAYPIPYWNMTSPGGGDIQFGFQEWSNAINAAEAYTILDNVTKIVGRHTLKTGFIYRLEHSAWESTQPFGLSFSGNLTVDPSTSLGGGAGLAQFMLGAVPNGTQAGLFDGLYNSWAYKGLYVQDDFKVKPNFTVDVGLRWDIFDTIKTRFRPQDNFCFSCTNAATGLPGQVIYPGDPGYRGGNLYPANLGDFGPRANFAWTPFADHKTVIRGGYDIFYSNAGSDVNLSAQGLLPGWQNGTAWNGSWFPNQCQPLSGQCVAFPLSDTSVVPKGSIATPPLSYIFAPQQSSPLYGQSFAGLILKTHDPMVQMWNLEVQRELPGNTMLSVGYVGQHGTHLIGDPFRSYNYVPTKDLLQYKTGINADVPITNFYTGKTAALLAQVWGSQSLPLSILLTPYPFYGALQNNVSTDGTTSYDGLNVRFQKRYSSGLILNVAYTFSKAINNAVTGQLSSQLVDSIHSARMGMTGGLAGQVANSGGYGGSFQNPDDRDADRAVAASDVPNILNIVAIYQLPFGTGKPFLNHRGLTNQILGGWVLTTNFNAESGVPISVTCPSDALTNRCDVIGNPKAVPGGHNANDWINPAAFQPAFGNDQSFWANPDPNDPRWWQYGTAGPRLPDLRSPGFLGDDASLMKRFPVSEKKYFEFRWEVFNAFNRQNLGFPNTNFCLQPLPDGTTDLVHQAGCAFGRITNVQTDPRNMEFALKFYY
jgi:hypothetical protein